MSGNNAGKKSFLAAALLSAALGAADAQGANEGSPKSGGWPDRAQEFGANAWRGAKEFGANAWKKTPQSIKDVMPFTDDNEYNISIGAIQRQLDVYIDQEVNSGYSVKKGIPSAAVRFLQMGANLLAGKPVNEKVDGLYGNNTQEALNRYIKKTHGESRAIRTTSWMNAGFSGTYNEQNLPLLSGPEGVSEKQLSAMINSLRDGDFLTKDAPALNRALRDALNESRWEATRKVGDENLKKYVSRNGWQQQQTTDRPYDVGLG